MTTDLVSEYAPRLEELLPLAKRAYGSRTNNTPEHAASREYTRLLVEYTENGGSLVAMAKELGVTYAGLRRRVTTDALPSLPARTRSRLTEEETELAIKRINDAKLRGPEAYHDQLAKEYANGASLAKIAKGLGLSSSQPLYFGVQRSMLRAGVQVTRQ
jgi:transposase-like protein